MGMRMPRKKTIKSDLYPYHVTNRTIDHVFYSLSQDKMWEIYTSAICTACWAYGAKVHAFILMGNHYHLLLTTPDANIDDIVQYFQSQVSREVCDITDSRAFRYESRYNWTLIRDRSYFINTYKYVYQNPIRAEIVSLVRDYPYSTFHGRAGYSRLPHRSAQSHVASQPD